MENNNNNKKVDINNTIDLSVLQNTPPDELALQLKSAQKEIKALKRKNFVLEQNMHAIEQNYAFQRNVFEKIKQQKKQQETYLQLVFEYTPDIILIIDRKLKLINATKNSLRRFGIELDEFFEEKSLVEIFAPYTPAEQNARTGRIISEVMREGVIKRFDEMRVKFGEKTYIFEINVVPLRDESKEIIGVMLSMHDVTNFHNALESAKRASKAKSSFLAKVSHEIRTPMNAIIGLSELILREEIAKEAREHVIGIKHAGGHLVSIINDILDFSKIESGKMEVVPVGYSLSSLLDYAIGIIRMRLIEKSILFTVNVEPDIPEFLIGDEIRLKQMVLNLLSNACKYCEEGFIKLKIDYQIVNNDTITLNIEVADSGIGIREENIGKLFGDFIQIGEAVGNKGVEGTGLGLAITRGFAAAMGGKITVESEYGVGSVFKISIPQKLDLSKSEVFAWVNDRKVSVLIYETREVYAASLVSSIGLLGIRCKSVSDQSMFFDEIRENKYDFVFVSSFTYDGTKKAFRELGRSDFTMVLITEYGESVIETDFTKTLNMPAHAGDIANIFNNQGKSGESDKLGTKFMAPLARVLIVDDINTNLIVAQGLMSQYKMTIDLAKSGREAIEAVQENDYDIVFMDHMMPEMDGIEASNRIRALIPTQERYEMCNCGNYYKNLPIVALTANAVSGMREMFLKNGFQDFLAKPIDTTLLDAILEKWLPKDKLESFTASETKKSDLPAFRIEGVDVESGIYMTGGDAANYLKTLSIFREDGLEKIDTLRNLLSVDDFQLYATHVHALKSALASIGAAKISNLARSLEIASKNKDRAFIEKNNEKFLEELTMLLESIKLAVASVATSKKKSGGEVDIGFIKENVVRLQQALEILDMEEVDSVLSLLRTKSDGEIDKILDDISNNILICEYDVANNLTENLIGVVENR
jgi:PAS domain S-box-containing protein